MFNTIMLTLFTIGVILFLAVLLYAAIDPQDTKAAP